jgi:hypothetical protein
MTSAALAGLLLRQPFPFVIDGDEASVYVDRASMVKHEPGIRIVTIM